MKRPCTQQTRIIRTTRDKKILMQLTRTMAAIILYNIIRIDSIKYSKKLHKIFDSN